MGGLALKNTFTRRYSREEFDTVSKELIDIIEGVFDNASIPLFFNKKETFGDIDIIVDIRCTKDSVFDGEFIRGFIERQFNPNEIFHNGNSWSFDYKEVQVDLICVRPEDFDSNYHYLAFNDLGNFIGRLAQSIGFKYGQEGLWYNHFSDANTKTKIIVSKDYPKIFDFLGLDYSKWKAGFDTLEDIFEYAMTSSLFNPEMFQLSTLNKINRERNFKRKSYMSFLEYIKDKPAHVDYNLNTIALCKANVIEMIKDKDGFPEANIDYHLAEINYRHARKTLIKMKFSGGIIKEKYELQGKELGDAIISFKNSITDKYKYGEWGGYTFDDFIIDFSLEEIFAAFDKSLEIK